MSMPSTLLRGIITSLAVRSAKSRTLRMMSAGSRPKRPVRSPSSTRASTSASVMRGSGVCSGSRRPRREPSQPRGTASGTIAISSGRSQRAAQTEARSACLRASVVLISKSTEVMRMLVASAIQPAPAGK